MNKTIAGWLTAVILIWSSGAVAATPDDFKTTADRDDYEVALFRDDASPGALCEYGTRNRRYHDPASACRAAYAAAMKAQSFVQATRYAALGCEAYGDKRLCLEMPKIPFPSAHSRAVPR